MKDKDQNKVIVVHNKQYLDAALKQVAGGEAAKNLVLTSYSKEKLSRANAIFILKAAIAFSITFCAVGLAFLLARGDIEFRLRWFNQWIGGSDASIIEVLPEGGVQTLIPVGELPDMPYGVQPFVLTPKKPGQFPRKNDGENGNSFPNDQVIPKLDTEIGLIQFPELRSDEDIPVVAPNEIIPNSSGTPIINEIVNLFTTRNFTMDNGQIITITAGHHLHPGAKRDEFHDGYCYAYNDNDGNGRIRVDLGNLQNKDAQPVMKIYLSGVFLNESEFTRAFKVCPWIK